MMVLLVPSLLRRIVIFTLFGQVTVASVEVDVELGFREPAVPVDGLLFDT
ncbi:MAG: hypothetical protein IPO44_00050 [Candidatus Microthrix sp.]|nr:hypothetical protein [Candidatus Microthrix sp.]MBK9558024.1 hypothetical protein [Candidatus Microthrix sp.]